MHGNFRRNGLGFVIGPMFVRHCEKASDWHRAVGHGASLDLPSLAGLRDVDAIAYRSHTGAKGST